MEKIDLRAAAIAFGVAWGLFVLSLGWMAAATGYGQELVQALGSLYLGYGATFLGGLVGAVWGFVDGAVGGAIVAYLYNRFSK